MGWRHRLALRLAPDLVPDPEAPPTVPSFREQLAAAGFNSAAYRIGLLKSHPSYDELTNIAVREAELRYVAVEELAKLQLEEKAKGTRYGAIKMGRRWYATRVCPGREVEFWEDGAWLPYSIGALQERGGQQGG